MIELNNIYNEDCLTGMSNISDKSIDMILCDLPYGTTQCKWDTIIPFDNCMGSGTTAIACLNTNRNYIGFEMDTTYYDIACRRIEDLLNSRKQRLFI